METTRPKNISNRDISAGRVVSPPSEILERARRDFKEFFHSLNGQRPDYFRALVSQLLIEDLNKTQEIVPLLTDSERAQVMTEVAYALLATNQGEFLAKLKNVPGAAKLDLYLNALLYFSKQGNADMMTKLHLEMPFSRSRESAIEIVAPAIARSGAGKAVAWLSSLSGEDEKKRALGALLRTQLKAGGDPELIEKLIPYAESSSDRGRLIQSAAGLWRLSGNRARGESLLNTVEAENRDFVRLGLLDENSLPDEFLSSLKGFDDQRKAKEAVARFFHSRTSRDPEGLANYAYSVSDDIFQTAIVSVMSAWIDLDSEMASEWIQKLPMGKRKDSASREFALKIRGKDRESAKTVAGWIADPHVRAVTLAEL